MKRFEEIFNAYGLGWAKVTNSSFYERLEDHMRIEIRKTRGDSISEHRMDSLKVIFFENLFQDAMKSLFIYDEERYLERHGNAVLFQQMPTEWKDKMRFGYVGSSMDVKMYGYLNYRYNPKDKAIEKNEKYQQLMDVCSDTFSEEEKLTHVFDTKLLLRKRKEFLERFIENILTETHKSVMWEQLKTELKNEMAMWIKRISKEEGKRVENGAD